MAISSRLQHRQPTFRELFTPKLVTVLREGYGPSKFKADLFAGLTVAVVALPLSMAIAIASGTTPDRGLYTAIVGGFLISLMGGSRFQIGGPAGAFIVLVAAIIDRHGFDGFLVATMIAGLILMAIGFSRLGSYIKYIPHPVTVGFTAGIGVIIFASQIRDLVGLSLPGREPGPVVEKVTAFWAVRDTASPTAISMALATIAVIVGLRRLKPGLPGLLIAVTGAALISGLLGLPVETIGTRFGGIPSGVPAPALPNVSWGKVVEVLPDAVSLALLGAIESLLSAVVADAMTGRRHRSNCELVAQGVANIGSALFGGICVTGTIARTATNIRSGAVGPVSGILHALFLLVFILFAAPLASYIPLAALAGVLATVAWNMVERHEFMSLLTRSRGEALVLLATFLLTVFRDVTEGILVGMVLGSFLFMHRMAQLVAVEVGAPLLDEDTPDEVAERPHLKEYGGLSEQIMVYRIAGPLFFGASASVVGVLEQLGRFPKVVVLDMSEVPLADSTAAASLRTFVDLAHRQGSEVFVAGARSNVRHVLVHNGLGAPRVRYSASVAEARVAASTFTALQAPPAMSSTHG
jgi:SulP family sulfate permease